MPIRLHAGDWLSLLLVAAFALVALLWSQLYTELWAGAIALRLLLGFLVLVAGLAGVCFAFARREDRPRAMALSVPLLLLAVWLGWGYLAQAGIWLRGQWVVAQHAEEFYPMRAGLAPIYPLIEGIPDGGTSVVRADARSEIVDETVGGNIYDCRQLRQGYWVCNFG